MPDFQFIKKAQQSFFSWLRHHKNTSEKRVIGNFNCIQKIWEKLIYKSCTDVECFHRLGSYCVKTAGSSKTQTSEVRHLCELRVGWRAEIPSSCIMTILKATVSTCVLINAMHTQKHFSHTKHEEKWKLTSFLSFSPVIFVLRLTENSFLWDGRYVHSKQPHAHTCKKNQHIHRID